MKSSEMDQSMHTNQKGSGYPIPDVQRSKKKARQAYNRMSSWYDWLAGSSEREYREKGLRVLQPVPGECVLEIGPGTGHSLAAIARAVADSGTAFGLDISEDMAGITLSRLDANNLSGQAAVVVGDGVRPPFRSSQFDAIFMSFTLELFDTPELPQILAECSRLLKPAGRLGLVSMDAQAKPSLMLNAYLRFRKWFPGYLDCRPIPLQSLLNQASFSIRLRRDHRMFGFPIAVILAVK